MRWFRSLATDGLVLLGVLGLLGLAPLARLAASDQQRPPAEISRLMPLPPHPRGGSLQDLPAGLPRGITVNTPADVATLAEEALGRTRGRALVALLDSPERVSVTSKANKWAVAAYPYQYPGLNKILAGVSGGGWEANATAFGAALIELASRTTHGGSTVARYPNAAPAAFAVLDRARAHGSCAPQLDVLLLVASDYVSDVKIVRTEAARAVTYCPGDPTAGWVLGQYLSQGEQPALGQDARPRAAEATFTELEKKYPASVAAITGAADARLRNGILLADSKPFTARNYFLAAEQGYERAARIGSYKDSAPGLARALIGLGRYAQAERILRHLIADSRTPGPLLELLIVAEENAHDFADAESDARHLTQVRQRAYPDGPALFPAPDPWQTWFFVDLLRLRVPEPTAPLSLGADRFAPLTVDLHLHGGAGASVEDLSFIPAYRSASALTGSEPACADWEWRRDAVLAGHASDALQGFPASPEEGAARNRFCFFFYEGNRSFHAVAQAEAGVTVTMSQATASQLADDRQNLWRWAGNMARAEDLIRAWAAASPADPTPELRLGEVQYLQKRYNAAAADFGKAARLTRTADYRNEIGIEEASLDRGAALFAAGRATEAIALLRDVEFWAANQVAWCRKEVCAEAERFAAVAYYARAQLADHERQSDAVNAAAEDYAAAQEMLPMLTHTTGVRPEALYNNSALAYLALGRLGDARAAAGKALAVDPANPAFLMTAGYIAERAGKTRAAIHYDAAALRSDIGAYPAANDLGVELARQHDDAAAAEALRKAVGARPDYALGWFNLGLLYAQMGPGDVLASQGAFGQAFALNPALRERERQLMIDASVYRTGLDLSKPLPPHWSFAQAQRGSPVAAVGLLGAALLAFGLARVRGKSAVKDFVDRWLEPLAQSLERIPVINRLRRPVWALGATVTAFLLPLAHKPINGAATAAAYGIGVLVLATAGVRARVVIARAAGMTTRQESWGPGVLFGLVMGAAGMPWAPLPVLRVPDESRRTHLAAPVALSVLGAFLLIESVWLKVPLAESLGAASLIMAASTLLPLSPLDGAKTVSGGLAAGAGVLAAAVFLGLGLV